MIGALPPLYRASIPVFHHYLGQLKDLLRSCPDAILKQRVVQDALTLQEHCATTIWFPARITYPLAGMDVPPEYDMGPDIPSLIQAAGKVEHLLRAIPAECFADAEDRSIQFDAGHANPVLSGSDFLHIFGMPNFLFHLTSVHILLRQQGYPIGKADFDGVHMYPKGFQL